MAARVRLDPDRGVAVAVRREGERGFDGLVDGRVVEHSGRAPDRARAAGRDEVGRVPVPPGREVAVAAGDDPHRVGDVVGGGERDVRRLHERGVEGGGVDRRAAGAFLTPHHLEPRPVGGDVRRGDRVGQALHRERGAPPAPEDIVVREEVVVLPEDHEVVRPVRGDREVLCVPGAAQLRRRRPLDRARRPDRRPHLVVRARGAAVAPPHRDVAEGAGHERDLPELHVRIGRHVQRLRGAEGPPGDVHGVHPRPVAEEDLEVVRAGGQRELERVVDPARPQQHLRGPGLRGRVEPGRDQPLPQPSVGDPDRHAVPGRVEGGPDVTRRRRPGSAADEIEGIRGRAAASPATAPAARGEGQGGEQEPETGADAHGNLFRRGGRRPGVAAGRGSRATESISRGEAAKVCPRQRPPGPASRYRSARVIW